MPRSLEKARRTLPLPLVLATAVLCPAVLCSPSIAQRPSASASASEVKTLAPLEPGITLPVATRHSLRPGKDPVGTRVLVRTTQRIPIAPDLYLNRGAELLGEVTASTSGSPASSQLDTLSLRFTALRYRHQTVPISTNAIAIANLTNVSDTAAPANGSTDRGNPSPASWTTRQVGGDEVYRSGWSGDVCDTVMRKVGFADFNGVYRDPPSSSAASPNFPLALGVFSASAAGLYGFDSGAALHSADGVVTLTAPPHRLVLRAGDNLLLEVVAPR